MLLRLCHDLRTHLRSIQPYAESLLKSGEGAASLDAAKKLGFIVDGARKLDLLVEDLASYAVALEIDTATFRLTPMDIVLRGVLMKLDKELRADHAKVSYDKLPRIWGDPDRLGQAFEILLRNCLLMRGGPDPLVHIVAEPHLKGWLFTVHGNTGGGDGIDVGRIFRPFERFGPQARTGSGLRLATCRIIVERHGGRIWAESRSGESLAFLFTLPRPEGGSENA